MATIATLTNPESLLRKKRITEVSTASESRFRAFQENGRRPGTNVVVGQSRFASVG